MVLAALTPAWSHARTLRLRGLLTIEVVGEFLGMDTDEGLHANFRRHCAEWSPAFRWIHRPTFVRQAADPWARKDLPIHMTQPV